jgi:hypothetical protein
MFLDEKELVMNLERAAVSHFKNSAYYLKTAELSSFLRIEKGLARGNFT